MIDHSQAKRGGWRLGPMLGLEPGPRLVLIVGLIAFGLTVAAAPSAWAQSAPTQRKARGLSGSAARKAGDAGGGHGGGPDTPPSHIADIRSFGARPDDPAFDNTIPIQRAHDSLLTREGRMGGVNRERGVVLIPSGTWWVRSPVWFDGDYIELHGVGSTSVISSGPFSCAPIILGKKRLEYWKSNQSGGHFGNMPRVFAPDHRVDLFGRLDKTACPERDRFYGLRTYSPSARADRADHYITFWAQPPCFGSYDYWAKTQKLMIQVCMEGPNGGPMGPGAIMGLGGKEDHGGPAPWIFQAGDNLFQDSKYHFMFRTQEGGLAQNGINHIREFSFGNFKVKGIQRIAIQLDFSADDADGLCNIQAYINGHQVPVTRGFGTRLARATGHEPSFTADDGLHFIANETGNFEFGAAGSTSQPLYGINTLCLYGLRIGNQPLYRDRGPGAAETRIDGRPNNDSLRYLDPTTDRASTICYLPMTDKPHEPNRATDRLVSVNHGAAAKGAYSFAMFHADSFNEINGDGSVYGNRVRNVHLVSENECGVALALGRAFDCKLYDSEFVGGWYGVASTNEGGYDYLFMNNLMSGRDAGFYGMSMIIEGHGFPRVEAGRTLMRFTGCSVRWSDIRIGDVNGTEAYIKITGDSAYGGQYKFDGIDSDNEGKPLPTVAAIYCERRNGPLTMLDVQNVNPGTVPDGVPMIKLVDRYPAPGHPGGAGLGKVYVRNVLTQQVGIQTDGPGWEGEVHDVTPCSIWRIHTGEDGQSNVVVHQRLDSVPSYGAWQANAHIIEIRHPEPGGAQAYLCSRSGIGTWDAATEYGPTNMVFRNGSIYLARKPSKNSPPPSAPWAAVENWTRTAKYPAHVHVVWDGKLWISLAANTNSQPTPENKDWVAAAPAVAAQFSPIAVLGAPVP